MEFSLSRGFFVWWLTAKMRASDKLGIRSITLTNWQLNFNFKLHEELTQNVCTQEGKVFFFVCPLQLLVS